MAFNLHFIITFIALCLFQHCTCTHVKSLNASLAGFQPAVATFFGAPNGAGSDGGACGYTNAVSRPPYNSFVSAGNAPLFRKGLGCGACYQVRCNLGPCSGNPVTVTITDECPGCSGAIHFDLSGTAMGAMAKPGQADVLRNMGNIAVSFQRVPCQYKNTNVAFKVDSGSNANFLSVNVEFENGDGDLNLVELVPARSTQSITMNHIFGATWSTNINPSAQPAPYSIRLTTEFNKKLTAPNVIPVGWKPGQTYKSNMQCNLDPCSGNPVTATITDECPSCSGTAHFDLSGTAMGAMAKPGQADALRGMGSIAVSYQRVPWQYQNTNVAFKVYPGSNANFLSVNVEFENGDGDLNLVELVPSRSTQSITMNHVFGATWSTNINPSAQPAPYSIRLTTEFNKKLTAPNVIPVGWKPGQTYKSNVNF